VIDVAADVTAHSGIADVKPVQLETPDVALFEIARLAPQALLVRDFLPSILDDAGIFRDGLSGKNAPALDSRTPLLNHEKKGRKGKKEEE
jgi:hypothetical protein